MEFERENSAGEDQGSLRATVSRFPKPASAAMIEEMGRYVVAEVYPFVVDLDRCHGMWLGTVDGDQVFDWAGYYASKLIGHNHAGLSEPDYVRRLVRAATAWRNRSSSRG